MIKPAAEGILTLDVQEYELCITAVEWYRLLAHGIRLGGSKIVGGAIKGESMNYLCQ